jgi:hypothetical protein
MIHVSPRLGFSYTYNRDRDNGSGASFTPVGHYFRSVTGTLRGGIGEFRDLLRPNVLADASAATGLTGEQRRCPASARRYPFRIGRDSRATRRRSQPSASTAVAFWPSVRRRSPLIDRGYDVPRSWRASLDWTTSIRSWVIRANTLGSYDLSQPEWWTPYLPGPQVDAGRKGDRPVFVSQAGIDPNTRRRIGYEGARSSQYGRVAERVSDLKGYGGQFTFGVAPIRSSFARVMRCSRHSATRSRRRSAQYRGFDGAAFGDPRTIEWAPGRRRASHLRVERRLLSPSPRTIRILANQSGCRLRRSCRETSTATVGRGTARSFPIRRTRATRCWRRSSVQ